MRLQSFSVIFVIIIVPLILVLSYYLSLQIKTITNQNEYDNNLLSATYDAMSSFEINTANEDLSSVSDSLRTIIEASCNIFTSTLATNLGMSNASKSYIEPFVPALLYTLYDGYYIYAPTNVPDILTDSQGNALTVGANHVRYGKGTGTYTYNENETDDYYLKCTTEFLDNLDDYGQLLYKKAGVSNGYTANIEEASLKQKNVLKSYMPYSAKYSQKIYLDGIENDVNVNIIYTLDNFVTIEGTVGNVYVSKSGYLIPTEYADTGNPTLICSSNSDLLTCYSQSQARAYIEAGNVVTLRLDPDGSNITISTTGQNCDELRTEITNLNIEMDTYKGYLVHYYNGTVTNDISEAVKALLGLPGGASDADCKDALEARISGTGGIIERLNNIQYSLDLASTVEYYVEAYIFSNWVDETFQDLEEGSLVEISGQNLATINGTEEVLYRFEGKTSKVFDLTGTTQGGVYDIPVDSPFVTHKINVIRNSIQYNLNMAMSSYNNTSSSLFEYEMPVLDAAEWDKVLTNVSIVSFMQGYSAGLKMYNNYKIVTSTNNELTVSPSDIYYVKKEDYNFGQASYHKIDCPKLMNSDDGTFEYLSFRSKEVKYDKIYDKTSKTYKYDHQNYACYDCINDGNYIENNIFREGADSEETTKLKNLQKAYYMGVGKERNDVYKMNAVADPQCYETIYIKDSFNNPSSLALKNVRKIYVTISPLKFTSGTPEPIINYTLKIRGTNIKDSNNNTEYAIYYNETTSTFEIDVDPTVAKSNGNTFQLSQMTFTNLNGSSRLSADGGVTVADSNMGAVMDRHVLCIKVIYK